MPQFGILSSAVDLALAPCPWARGAGRRSEIACRGSFLHARCCRRTCPRSTFCSYDAWGMVLDAKAFSAFGSASPTPSTSGRRPGPTRRWPGRAGLIGARVGLPVGLGQNRAESSQAARRPAEAMAQRRIVHSWPKHPLGIASARGRRPRRPAALLPPPLPTQGYNQVDGETKVLANSSVCRFLRSLGRLVQIVQCRQCSVRSDISLRHGGTDCLAVAVASQAVDVRNGGGHRASRHPCHGRSAQLCRVNGQRV